MSHNFLTRYLGGYKNASLSFEIEHQFQKEVEKWREFEKENTPPLELLFSIPNGQYRKGQRPEPCMLKGVPDCFFSFPYDGYCGLYIELKLKPNKPSKDQKRVMRMLKGVGYRVEVCYSFEEVIDVFEDYLRNWEQIPF